MLDASAVALPLSVALPALPLEMADLVERLRRACGRFARRSFDSGATRPDLVLVDSRHRVAQHLVLHRDGRVDDGQLLPHLPGCVARDPELLEHRLVAQCVQRLPKPSVAICR